MPRARTPALLTLAALAFLGVLALIFWRLSRPPEITRLLPEADAIVFADLRPIRLATHLERDLPARSPDYQHFVDATGIVPERDLDQAAFALTRRPDPTGANGPAAYTEIFSGRFDPARLERYLATLTPTTEAYTGHTIYILHMAAAPTGTSSSASAAEGRDLRISVVRPGLLAVSNTPTPEQIHAILDHARSHTLFSPSPSLLTDRFPDVPRLSTVWAIGRLGLPFAQPTAQSADPGNHLSFLGLSLPIPADQSFVASLRYVGVLRLRVEALAPSPDAALQEAAALTSLAGLARSLLTGQPSAQLSPDLTAALSSLRIEPHGSRAVLTASLPLALVRQLTGSAAAAPQP